MTSQYRQVSGLRGLRLSLIERKLFDTQLEAILQASKERDIRILFPMVIDANDLRLAIDRVRSLVKKQGLSKLPKIGAMIETPSAIFQIGEIIEQVNILSIGTNDLSQFMLAADRQTISAMDDHFALHPATGT